MGLVIGRKKELSDLEEYCRSQKAELICVYGRRRVGKTYLVESMFHGTFAFAATGSEDRRNRAQMRAFTTALRRFGDQSRRTPADWYEAFDRLRDVLESNNVVRSEQGRRVVFLDEFPWFAAKRTDFLFAFADFWNGWASRKDDVVVVICGSSTSWIIKNVLRNTGSLYNRVTRQIYLAPFTLRETEEMIDALGLGWSRTAILHCYLVFGGLPYYLDMLDRRKSLAQNVTELCFGPHARLAHEVPLLMEATLGNSPLHRDILRELAGVRAGMRRNELSARLGNDSGSLKRALDDLEQCGYIRSYKNRYERYTPTVYQLIDPFLLFGFKFLDGAGEVDDWSGFERTHAYYAWRGNAFEMACICHVRQIKHAIGISAVRTKVFPWMSSKSDPAVQIDLVIERADSVTNICEMKCTDDAYAISKSYEAELRHKVEVFREESGTDNALQLTLVASAGLKSNVHSWDVMHTVTMDDLFAF